MILDTLLCCSRQVGKTQTASCLTLKTAMLEAPALILVLSPSERQSAEFILRVKSVHGALSSPQSLAAPVLSYHEKIIAEAGKDEPWLNLPAATRESALQLHLANGSRIIGLPASEKTIRVYSGVNLLVIDEAARVPDELYYAVRPMLAVSKGRILLLSTPFGKRGFFYETCEGRLREEKWNRIAIKAHQCGRIPREFLQTERDALGDRWFRQEYECSFEDPVDSVFSSAFIERATRDDVEAWVDG